jgi:hypothetical protein
MTTRLPIWTVPADFADRFPDGDYTIGRGADPRGKIAKVASEAVKTDKSASKPPKPRRVKKSVRSAAE